MHPASWCVDDEADLRELLEITLLKMGLDVDSAATLREARALLAERDYALVLTDMRLPDGLGLELVREVARLRQGHADRRHHRLRQRRQRRGGAEGRRLRLHRPSRWRWTQLRVMVRSALRLIDRAARQAPARRRPTRA